MHEVITTILFISYVRSSSQDLTLSNCVKYTSVETHNFLKEINYQRKLVDLHSVHYIKSSKVELNVTERLDHLSQNYLKITSFVPGFTHFYRKMQNNDTRDEDELVTEALSTWSRNMYGHSEEYGDLDSILSPDTLAVKCRSCRSEYDNTKYYIFVCKWLSALEDSLADEALADEATEFSKCSPKTQFSFVIIFMNVLLLNKV